MLGPGVVPASADRLDVSPATAGGAGIQPGTDKALSSTDVTMACATGAHTMGDRTVGRHVTGSSVDATGMVVDGTVTNHKVVAPMGV